MIGFFPAPYPDELFFSCCARYRARLGFPSSKKVLLDLFGTDTALAVVDLPSRLAAFVSNLPTGGLTCETIIRRHTFYPLYAAFQTRRRASQIYDDMISDRGRSIHLRAGIMAGRVRPPKYLRYCPDCDRDSLRRFGDLYWNRLHQVAGIDVCGVHRVWLEEEEAERSNRTGRHIFVPRAKIRVFRRRAVPPSDRAGACHLRLEKVLRWLLNHDVCHDPRQARRRYLSGLSARGFVTDHGRIRQADLHAAFQAKFNALLLRVLQCGLSNRNDNWLTRLLRKPRGVQAPLRHLLLIDFLEKSPETIFFDTSTASSNDGMARRRRGYRQRPQEWKAALQSLWADRAVSLREIARRLEVDPLTVKRHAATLGLPFPRVARRPTKGNPRQLQLRLDLPKRISPTKKRREWLSALRRVGGWTICRRAHPALYAWLYRHDRDWLRAVAPSKRTPSGGVSADWMSRDRILIDQLRTLQLPGRERHTFTSIGRRLQATAWLQKHPEKLPLAVAAIRRMAETREEYGLRRLRLTMEQLGRSVRISTPSQLRRLAGLRPGVISNDRLDRELLFLTRNYA